MTLWWTLLYVMCAICGVIIHACKHLVEARKTDKALTFKDYFAKNIPQSITSIVGTIVLFMIALEAEQLNVMMAFSCGVMGNSVADIIGKRASKLGQ